MTIEAVLSYWSKVQFRMVKQLIGLLIVCVQQKRHLSKQRLHIICLHVRRAVTAPSRLWHHCSRTTPIALSPLFCWGSLVQHTAKFEFLAKCFFLGMSFPISFWRGVIRISRSCSRHRHCRDCCRPARCWFQFSSSVVVALVQCPKLLLLYRMGNPIPGAIALLYILATHIR